MRVAGLSSVEVAARVGRGIRSSSRDDQLGQTCSHALTSIPSIGPFLQALRAPCGRRLCRSASAEGGGAVPRPSLPESRRTRAQRSDERTRRPRPGASGSTRAGVGSLGLPKARPRCCCPWPSFCFGPYPSFPAKTIIPVGAQSHLVREPRSGWECE